MTRIARLGLLHAVLLFVLIVSTGGQAWTRHSAVASMQATATSVQSPLPSATLQSTWTQLPTADPDGSKASLGTGSGDDTAASRTAVRIDWPLPGPQPPPSTGPAVTTQTHPPCASPPRAPPHA